MFQKFRLNWNRLHKMPKLIDRTARPRKLSDALTRSKRYEVTRTGVFIDPFPFIHGTKPEKIVYAALSRRGIPFLFLNDIRFQLPEIEFDKTYQADFIIPAIKVIIEVQGAHWHSMPKTIEADAFKMAIYETGGYQVRAWWDYDILDHIDQMISEDPLIMSLATNPVEFASRELPVTQRTKIDTSQGIRTLNKKRAIKLQYKKILKFKGRRTKPLNRYTV